MESAVKASLLWGLKPDQGVGEGIDNSPNVDGDPAGKPVDVKLNHEATWDPSDAATQAQVGQVLAELQEQPQLYTSVTNNPLDTCDPASVG